MSGHDLEQGTYMPELHSAWPTICIACKERRPEAESETSYTSVHNSLFFLQVFHVVHFECPASTLPSQRQSLV